MLHTLAKAVDRDNQLKNVFYALLDDNPHFITGIELQFTSFSITFRAADDEETLSIKIGRLEVDPLESLVDVSSSEFWLLSKEAHIVWGWRLTNQQGYDDGVRLEFSKPEGEFNFVVEFVVTASAIQIFLVSKDGIAIINPWKECFKNAS